MLVVKHSMRTLADLVLYGKRSGRWWLPILAVLLAIVTLLILAIKTVVPAAVYVLF